MSFLRTPDTNIGITDIYAYFGKEKGYQLHRFKFKDYKINTLTLMLFENYLEHDYKSYPKMFKSNIKQIKDFNALNIVGEFNNFGYFEGLFNYQEKLLDEGVIVLDEHYEEIVLAEDYFKQLNESIEDFIDIMLCTTYYRAMWDIVNDKENKISLEKFITNDNLISNVENKVRKLLIDRHSVSFTNNDLNLSQIIETKMITIKEKLIPEYIEISRKRREKFFGSVMKDLNNSVKTTMNNNMSKGQKGIEENVKLAETLIKHGA